jgi:hypothetical protein
MTFQKHGFEVVPNAVGSETCDLLSRNIRQIANNYRFITKSGLYQSDDLVEKCYSKYGVESLEVLSEMLIPKIEKVVNKVLVPSYTYCRIYYNEAEMPEHLDRPSCEYSVTLTLSVTDEPWEIWFKDLTGNTQALSLDVGSMCVYEGAKIPHWRTKYKGKEQIQAFLHYVDVNGSFADFKYDGRPMMGLHPSMRRKNFNIR